MKFKGIPVEIVLGVVVPAVSLFILLPGIAYLIYLNEAEWKAFSAEHNCKVVAKISGSVFNTYTVGQNGQMQMGVGSTPDRTGWLCDDGVTYYR